MTNRCIRAFVLDVALRCKDLSFDRSTRVKQPETTNNNLMMALLRLKGEEREGR
jgi:hypothetical protein